MPYTSEIEKLERRYAENPKGRNFAPLADAYRKGGQLDQAIELCKSGLERHPDYVSAHIVYGRCLIDLKDDGGAQQVFNKVLELDQENVIAFRVLAEIAARSKRFDVAVGWLTKLLAADPMNGDAAEALAFAKGKATQAAAAVAAAAPPPPAPAPPDFVVEHTSVQPVTPTAAAPPAPGGDLETFDGTLDFNALAHDAAKAEGLEVQEDVVLKPSAVVIEGLARTQYEGSGVFKADDDDDMPQVDLPLIMPDDASSEPQPPRRPTPPRTQAPVAAAVALSDDDGAADTVALSRAEPLLTETMAELFLKQGHADEALRVYRALLAQRPADTRLRARIAAIAGGGKPASGQSVQAFLRALLAGRPGMVATSPLDSAFAQATPDMDTMPGEATHAADDTISLDQVFGEESGRAAGAEEVPPPPSPPPHGPPAPRASGATQTGGFSFDEFFGSTAPARNPNAPASSSPAAPAPKQPGRLSGPRAKQALEDEGDLDQFQTWLKGLKT